MIISGTEKNDFDNIYKNNKNNIFIIIFLGLVIDFLKFY